MVLPDLPLRTTGHLGPSAGVPLLSDSLLQLFVDTVRRKYNFRGVVVGLRRLRIQVDYWNYQSIYLGRSDSFLKLFIDTVRRKYSRGGVE